MSFDKIKAMRSAERFLSQGKIRAAINEYKKVVEENPKDFSTLNIMGDLYVKNSENNEAVQCYRLVAEHYYGQGFANKAIAIYNKIARLQPESMEVTARLAQLYEMRGSYAEARDQYTKLAEHYQNKGQKIEALAVWKQIAELDPNNTEVYLTIAESCLLENQKSEAVDAFTEAGLRFNSQESYESAVTAFSKALKIKSNNVKTLKGFVVAKIGLGCADEAAETLEKVLAEDLYNRDILLLLLDCYLDMNSAAKAEKTVITLVQQEPGNYPRFLDVVEVYMKENDLESSVRVLSVSYEHILGAGYSDGFLGLINEILTRNPEYIEGLRLLVRYYMWHRNDVEIRKSLERLAETARLTESVEDERYALAQLAAITPLQTEYSERLQELKKIHGFEDVEIIEEAIQEESEVPEFENFIALNGDDELKNEGGELVESFEQYNGGYNFEYEGDASLSADTFNQNDESETIRDFNFYGEDSEINYFEDQPQLEEFQVLDQDSEIPPADSQLNLSDELRLQKEIESIEFYTTQGYSDLALKCLDSLIEEFGQQPKFDEIRQSIFGVEQSATEVQVSEFIETAPPLEAQIIEAVQVAEEKVETDEVISPAVNIFEQFRSDLGLEDTEEIDEGDYSTHYHTAIAYKEMGLMEDAIKEFQNAISLVEIDDETRRYFQCANLLGHCFMMKGMPNLAQTWFKRALETPNLDDDEIQALNYELASAYEASGEKEKAFQHFEQVYALDVDYRDIGQRIQNLSVSVPT
jgi:tetratricopeptide (TPR) repeat protein